MEKFITRYVSGLRDVQNGQYHSETVKTDDDYKYLTGFAFFCKNTPVTFDVEIRDDFKSLFSIAPAMLWNCVEPRLSPDLNNTFRQCHFDAAGKNIYVNFRAPKYSNIDIDDLIIVLRQSNTIPNYKNIDFFTCDVPEATDVISFTFPSNFTKIIGVLCLQPVTCEFETLSISRSGNSVISPIPLSLLSFPVRMDYKDEFFPLSLECSGRKYDFEFLNLKSNQNNTAKQLVFILSNN